MIFYSSNLAPDSCYLIDDSWGWIYELILEKCSNILSFCPFYKQDKYVAPVLENSTSKSDTAGLILDDLNLFLHWCNSIYFRRNRIIIIICLRKLLRLLHWWCLEENKQWRLGQQGRGTPALCSPYVCYVHADIMVPDKNHTHGTIRTDLRNFCLAAKCLYTWGKGIIKCSNIRVFVLWRLQPLEGNIFMHPSWLDMPSSHKYPFQP